MSYNKEIKFIKSYINVLNSLDEVLEIITSPITDQEIKNYDYFLELKEELNNNKNIVKDTNEKEALKQFRAITEKENFEDPNYRYLEKKIFAFTEIDRLSNDYENFISKYYGSSILTISQFQHHSGEHPLDLKKIKELKDIALKINEPIKFLDQLEKLNADSQIEKVFAYSKDDNLINNFLKEKEIELEIKPEASKFKRK